MQNEHCAKHWAGAGGLPAEPSISYSPPQPGEVNSPWFTPLNVSLWRDLLTNEERHSVIGQSITSEPDTSQITFKKEIYSCLPHCHSTPPIPLTICAWMGKIRFGMRARKWGEPWLPSSLVVCLRKHSTSPWFMAALVKLFESWL